jgi:hypothetical protein
MFPVTELIYLKIKTFKNLFFKTFLKFIWKKKFFRLIGVFHSHSASQYQMDDLKTASQGRNLQTTIYSFFSIAEQPLVGQNLLFIEVSRSHSDTPQSKWLLWTSDQPDAETSPCLHTTLTRERYPWPRRGFESAIPTSRRPQTDVSDSSTSGIRHLYKDSQEYYL